MKHTHFKLNLTLLFSIIFLLLSYGLKAQDWQREYKVGDTVELKINDVMWQKGVVAENPIDGLLRVNCNEYVDPSGYNRAGGLYIVHSNGDIRPLVKQRPSFIADFKAGDKVEGLDNDKWYNATILEKKGEGYLVHWDGFSSTYDAIVPAAKVRKKTGSASNEAEGSAPKMKDNLPDLPGTWWALKSMTKRGAAIKEYGVLPTMDFCKSGMWTLGRGSTNEGGKYQITGSRIIFRYEDGSVWGDYKMSWNAATGILELTDDTNTIRMIYKNKLNNC